MLVEVGPALRVLGMGGWGALGCPCPGLDGGRARTLHSRGTQAPRVPRDTLRPGPPPPSRERPGHSGRGSGCRGENIAEAGCPGRRLARGLSRRAQVRCGEETLHPGLRLADWSLSALRAPERPATHSHLQDREGLSHTLVQIQGCFHVGREVREGARPPGCSGKPFMGMRCCVWLSETGVGTLPEGGIHHMGDRSHLTPQSRLTVAESVPGPPLGLITQ